MTKIFIPQPIPENAAARLRKLADVTIYPHVDRQMPYEEMLEAVEDKDILYALGEIPYDKQLIDRAKNLKLIAAMHASAKFVDAAAATRRNIPLTGIPTPGLTKTASELTFALLIATAWRIPEADEFTRQRRWQQNQSVAFMTSRLYGKTLGIVGMGRIGQLVARKAAAFDMRMIYNKRTPLSPAEEFVLGGAEYRGLDDLFMESDFIVMACSLTKETKGLVDENLISLMKPSAIFINTSRGEVVDEAALENALVEGRIRGAGLDVYRNEVPEPNPGPSERFMKIPNVVFTPHIGSAARETREEMAMRTVDNIERFLAGKRPYDVLNPEVYGEASVKDERIG